MHPDFTTNALGGDMGALPKGSFRALLREALAAYESLEAQLADSQALVQASQRRPELHLHRQLGKDVSPESPNLPGMVDPEPQSTRKQLESSVEVAKGQSAPAMLEARHNADSLLPLPANKAPAVASSPNQSQTSAPASAEHQPASDSFSSVVPSEDIKQVPSDDLLTGFSFVEDLDPNCEVAVSTALENPEQVKSIVQKMSEQILREQSGTIGGVMKRMGTAEFNDKGCMARVARSKSFETLTLLVVIVNGIWIAIDADFNDASFILGAHLIFQVMEHLFCAIFLSEIFIRMLAFKSRWQALRDPWFVFDGILVSLMVVETWVMIFVTLAIDSDKLGVNVSVLRLLRLARLLRLSRVVRAVPELSFMVKGVLEATRGVACTMLLLLGVLYVFGIALKQLSGDTEMGLKYFSNVPHAMFTLFAQGTLLDSITILVIEVYNESLACAVLVLMVVDVAALTLMNMLVGILCEVMCNVAHSEKEQMALVTLKEQVMMALEELDTDKDMLISKDEFLHLICNLKASTALQGIGVDVVSLVDYADYFFQSDKHGEEFEEKWSFDHFMEEVIRVRGVNAATVRDIIDLRKFIHSQYTVRNVMIRQIQEDVATLSRNQTKLEQLLVCGLPENERRSLRQARRTSSLGSSQGRRDSRNRTAS